MTRIIYERDQYSLHLEGHAGFDQAGADIVCAGVSALTEALLRQLQRRENWRVSCGLCRQNALVRVRLYPGSRRAAQRARALLETVCGGYQAIAEEYPDYVKVEVR